MKYIDLRSDTVTKPTEEMREAMAKALVGDDVFSDDPTMNELEALVAKTLGKESGVFIPSGTFSNQLALFTHCQQGQEVIVDQFAHIVQHESGASPIISGVQLFTLESDLGIWDLDKLEKMIKKRSISTTETKLICIENAYNGRALPLDYFEKVKAIADKHSVKVHLDGARIFNAALALGVEVSDIASYADTVSVCLSKGLCAPIGSVLVGILAAAGKIAVEKMSKRLHIDHENAEYMASLLREIPGIIIDERQRDINMVFFDIDDDRKYNLESYLFENGVKILGYEDGFRFVAHNDIDKKEIQTAINLVKDLFR